MGDARNPELLTDIGDFLDLIVTEIRVPGKFAFFFRDNNDDVGNKTGLLFQFHCQTNNKGIGMIRMLGQ